MAKRQRTTESPGPPAQRLGQLVAQAPHQVVPVPQVHPHAALRPLHGAGAAPVGAQGLGVSPEVVPKGAAAAFGAHARKAPLTLRAGSSTKVLGCAAMTGLT